MVTTATTNGSTMVTATDNTYLKKHTLIETYTLHGLIGEGSFGHVYLGIHKPSSEKRAIKQLKGTMGWEHVVPLREIQLFMELSRHANIVILYEVYWEMGDVYLVFENIANGSLQDLLDARFKRSLPLPESDTRNIIQQILRGVHHLHANRFIHRDIKPENILLQGETVKVADFSMARAPSRNGRMTEYVSTRWYRAPELLLGADYSFPVDIFAVGCIAAELLSLIPIFPGANPVDQLAKVLRVLGAPKVKTWPEGAQLLTNYSYCIEIPSDADPRKFMASAYPNSSMQVRDFILCMLWLNPSTRATAAQSLSHAFLSSEAPCPSHDVTPTNISDKAAASRVVSATPTHRNRVVSQKTAVSTDRPSFGSPIIVNPYLKSVHT